MTCIVGLKTPTGCLLGADSTASAAWSCTTRVDPKAFLLTPRIGIGFTASYRMGQILRFHLEPPAIEGDEYEWTVRRFVPAAREALKTHGYMKVENNREESGTFLLAVRNRLFSIEDDFQVAEAADSYDACGCGRDIARGALRALSSFGQLTRESLGIALEAAEWYSNGVRGPFMFLETTL